MQRKIEMSDVYAAIDKIRLPGFVMNELADDKKEEILLNLRKELRVAAVQAYFTCITCSEVIYDDKTQYEWEDQWRQATSGDESFIMPEQPKPYTPASASASAAASKSGRVDVEMLIAFT